MSKKDNMEPILSLAIIYLTLYSIKIMWSISNISDRTLRYIRDKFVKISCIMPNIRL